MRANQPSTSQSASQNATPSMEDPSALRVLLVDDEQDMRVALALGLQVMGLKVMTASSGQEALDLLERNGSIAVLVTDLRMPNIDGVELLRRAQAGRPAALALEALVMSGNVNLEQSFEGLPGGCPELLVKPFPLREAADAIQRALARAAARRQQSGTGT